MPLLSRSGLSVAPRFRWECSYGQIIERYDERGHLADAIYQFLVERERELRAVAPPNSPG